MQVKKNSNYISVPYKLLVYSIFFFFAEQNIKRQKRSHPLPPADKIHHVLEDFSANWDRPLTHIKPLDMFLRRTLKDLYNIKCASSTNMFSQYSISSKSLDSQYCIAT